MPATRARMRQFLDFVNDPELGVLIPFLYPGANITVPQAPRNDLVAIFLTGIPGVNQPENVTTCGDVENQHLGCQRLPQRATAPG